MTQQLENRLRAAFLEKAEQIPAVAPPLELPPRRRPAASSRYPRSRRLAHSGPAGSWRPGSPPQPP